MDIPEKIICVDCGQDAHLISYKPEEGWQVGDYIAYRCRGCNDRWDLVVEDPSNERGDSFDFRQWLSDRGSE